jgi:hypothetical protein
MWMTEVPRSHPFILLIVGVQYHGEAPSATKSLLTSQIHELLASSAAYVEDLEKEGDSVEKGRSRVWLSYWESPTAYDEWWSSGPVADIWSSLPDDAGVWREKLTLPMSRVQFGTSQERPSGFAHLGRLVPNTTKSGYWGCYRDRIEEATATERLSSSLGTFPKPRKASGEVRRGRVKMDKFPENICVIVEGQDHSEIEEGEREHWVKHFDKPARKWITDVVTSGESGGVLSSRMCCAPSSGLISDRLPTSQFSTLNYNRKVQLLYFLDMECMERVGIQNKGHVALRENFMKSYCPVGPMAKGNLLMWVEMGILKATEIEAEYVGCYDGTGFMAFEDNVGFQESAQSQSWSGYLTKLAASITNFPS